MALSRQATLLAVAALCFIARVQAESGDEEYLLLKVDHAESISSLRQAFANALDECFEASAWKSTEVNLTQIVVHGGLLLTQERAAHEIDRDFRCIRTQLGQNDIWLTSGSVQQGNETAITTVHQWTAPSRPNIVLALADDLGWADVGWHTYSETGLESATPFLETLLPESTRLERMYTAPICSPSRAQLWTGRYFYRYGHGPAVTSGGAYGLSGRETTLSEILKGDGYHTAILGKWHLGYQDERLWPTFRGFDHHVGPFSLRWTSRVNEKSFRAKFLAQELYEDSLPGLSTLHNASIKVERLSFAGELPPLMDLDSTDPAYETMHNTDILKYESERYVHTYYASEARHKPLFLNVAFRSPHTPLEAPSRYATDKTLRELFVHKQVTSFRREYLRMVHAMDAAIEKTVLALQSEYVWDDTVFIFTSDNGGLDTPRGGASNWPLMGSKNAVWEGGIRVSTLVRGTLSPLARLESTVKGGTNEVYMHFVDFLPTIASGIAGISSEQYAQAWKCAHCLPHNNNTLDGVNRWRTIQTGESSRPDELRVLSVVTEEQVDLIEDIDLLQDFVPRAIWDAQVYKGTRFESLVNSTYSVDWTHAHNRVRVHGGGAVQYGPYKLAWGQSYAAHKLREDPFHIVTTHLRPDIFRRTKWNLPIRSPIDYGGVPRGHTDLVFLYNVEDDPRESVNLLRRKKISNKVVEIIRTMADFYKRTQQPDRAITDNYLRYAASFDPAEIVVGNETSKFFYPFCNISLRCTYDLPVIQSFETTAEPTLQPTPSPSVPPSTVKDIEIPSTPAPSSSPTQAPTLTPRQFRASLGRKRAVRLPRTRSFPRKCKAFLLLSKEIAATPLEVSTVRAYGRTWWKACLALCVKTLEDSCRGVSSTPRQSGSYECSIYGPGLEVTTRSPVSNLLHAVLDPRTCDI